MPYQKLNTDQSRIDEEDINKAAFIKTEISKFGGTSNSKRDSNKEKRITATIREAKRKLEKSQSSTKTKMKDGMMSMNGTMSDKSPADETKRMETGRSQK